MNENRTNFTSNAAACERQADVHRYHDGELAADEKRAFEAHLDACLDCQSLLASLREVSQTLTQFRSPEPADDLVEAIHASWSAAVGEEGVRRLAGWMSAAAAAVLVSAMLWSPAAPQDGGGTVAINTSNDNAANWSEAVAVMPPTRAREDSGGHLIQVAQWMANDLSTGEQW